MWVGTAAKRSLFRSPDEDMQRAIDDECDISTVACPGEGRCHGCVSWCDDCGDVGEVCHGIECDRHRCHTCNVMLTDEDRDVHGGTSCECAACCKYECCLGRKT